MTDYTQLSNEALDALWAEKGLGLKVRVGQHPAFLTPKVLVEVWRDAVPGIHGQIVGMDGREGWVGQ